MFMQEDGHKPFSCALNHNFKHMRIAAMVVVVFGMAFSWFVIAAVSLCPFRKDSE